MDAGSDNRDRISELPDSLILLILSFLPMSGAVRTTILSKRWNDRWTALPSLKFHDPDVGDLDKFRSFTYGALLQWKGAKIFKLEFPFDYVIPHSRDLDAWLLFAIGKGVEELCLYLGRCRRVDSYYSPPLRLYSCSSIRTLTLSYVKLRVPENARMSRLTSLTVEGSKSLSELAMARLLSGAPRLEELVLLVGEVREGYDIRSESLKILRIGRHRSCFQGVGLLSALRIRAPNLSTFELCGFVYDGSFGLDVHLPSLTTVIVYGYLQVPPVEERRMFDQVIRNTCHAQSITLSDSWIKLLLQLKEEEILVEFSKAKYLKMYLDVITVDQMLAVLERFPQLVTLLVTVTFSTSPKNDGSSVASKKKKTSVSLSHLKTCKMDWFPSFYSDSSFALRAVEAVLENAEVLEKMVLEPSVEYGVYKEAPELLEKVLSMRRSSPNARVVISKGVQVRKCTCCFGF